MSDRLNIVAESRTVIGKKVKQLRREGIIPAVIYGGEEVLHVQMDVKPLRRVLRVAGTTDLIDVNVQGTPHTVIVRDIQQHVTRGDILHVDFLEVDMKSTLTTTIDLVSVGVAVPETTGVGRGELLLRHIEIECLPADLISEIEVDMGRIEKVSDHIMVRDLVPPKGISFVTDGDVLVARLAIPRGTETEEEEGEEIVEEVEVSI